MIAALLCGAAYGTYVLGRSVLMRLTEEGRDKLALKRIASERERLLDTEPAAADPLHRLFELRMEELDIEEAHIRSKGSIRELEGR